MTRSHTPITYLHRDVVRHDHTHDDTVARTPIRAQAVGDGLIDSIVSDNIPILTEQEKFNETATSSVRRIEAVLSGACACFCVCDMCVCMCVRVRRRRALCAASRRCSAVRVRVPACVSCVTCVCAKCMRS